MKIGTRVVKMLLVVSRYLHMRHMHYFPWVFALLQLFLRGRPFLILIVQSERRV